MPRLHTSTVLSQPIEMLALLGGTLRRKREGGKLIP
jgi:hypothetical protein